MERLAGLEKLHEVRGVVFDLDGTLIRGSRALPGAVDAVARLRRDGIQIVFCTQDTENNCAAIAARLNGLGFAAQSDDVISTGSIVARHLVTCYGGKPVLVVGTPKQIRFLSEHNIRLAEHDEAAQAVLVCLYSGFSAGDIKIACRAVWTGADFLAIARDRVFPTDVGPIPGTGALVKAIEYATRRRARILGKPGLHIAAAALRRLGHPAEAVLVVGDNVDVDVRMGKSAGCRTVLVLTGGSSADDARRLPSLRRPDIVLADVAELPDRLRRPDNHGSD